MARFKGIDIPNNKRVEIALTYMVLVEIYQKLY